jgi:hypothetical protein
MATVKTLITLWEKESFKVELLKEQDDPERKEMKWALFRLYGDDFYDDYGRHAILQVLYREDTNEVINFEIFNVSERMGQNPYDFPCVGSRDWLNERKEQNLHIGRNC